MANAGLVINLEYDANALAAPQSFRDGVQAAANMLQSVIFDPITVNILVGYGEWDGQPIPVQAGALGGVLSDIQISYSALTAALSSDATSATDTASVGVLPTTATLGGQSNFFVARAQAKAFGAISATDPTVDGAVGFQTNETGNNLIGAALTELTHAMGRLNGGGPLSLFEYTSPGVNFLKTATSSLDFTSPIPVYFSIDGGNTSLANFDMNFDTTQFLTQNDPLGDRDAGSTALTSLDMTMLDVLGFDVTAPTQLASPTIVPTVTAAGTRASVQTHGITVRENTAVAATSLIASVSAPSGDSIGYYRFQDTGTGGAHFSLNGVAQGSSVYVLSTQLNQLEYVGGATPGNDTLNVFGFDDNSGSTSSTAVTAVTIPLAGTSSNSFNNDGTSDILWRHSSGTVATWLMNNGQSQTSVGDGGAPTNWNIIDTGDFDGDGTSDIVWRDSSSGTVAIWEMNNGQVKASLGAGSAPSNWHIVATGDFNGDGKSDLLWRDANTGTLALWEMNGGTVTASLGVGSVAAVWQVQGAGDFNGDGKSDILFRNTTTGTVSIWEMNGAQVQAAVGLGDVGLNWNIAGIGDFNGDGTSDILFRDSNSGTIAIWEINNGKVTASIGAGSAPSNWQIDGTGDYNGDGKSDILWRDSNSGTVAIWEMNGGTVTASVGLGSAANSWTIVHHDPNVAMTV